MLRPLKVEIKGVLTPLMCTHWRVWPPLVLSDGQSTPEGLRDKGQVDTSEYQRLKVWQRVCGLTVMDPVKCMTCPLARRVEYREDVPYLISLDGKSVVRARDAEIHEGVGQHRGNLKMMSGRVGRGE